MRYELVRGFREQYLEEKHRDERAEHFDPNLAEHWKQAQDIMDRLLDAVLDDVEVKPLVYAEAIAAEHAEPKKKEPTPKNPWPELEDDGEEGYLGGWDGD